MSHGTILRVLSSLRVMTRFRVVTVGGIGLAVVLGLVLLRGRESDYSKVHVSTTRDLERELERLRESLRIPGLSAAIADRDRIVWERGFGFADLERSTRAQPETIFHLASLTKPYSATVLLQLADEGRVSLDAPVYEFGITMPGDEPVRV